MGLWCGEQLLVGDSLFQQVESIDLSTREARKHLGEGKTNEGRVKLNAPNEAVVAGCLAAGQ